MLSDTKFLYMHDVDLHKMFQLVLSHTLKLAHRGLHTSNLCYTLLHKLDIHASDITVLTILFELSSRPTSLC